MHDTDCILYLDADNNITQDFMKDAFISISYFFICLDYYIINIHTIFN